VPTPHNWDAAVKTVPDPKATEVADGDAFSYDKSYATWGNQIVKDWRSSLRLALSQLDASEGQAARAEQILSDEIAALGTYLSGIEGDIDEYQHELTRLAKLEASESRGELPFIDELVAAKQAEVRPMPLPWVAAVRAQEQALIDQLSKVLASDKRTQIESQSELTNIYNPQGMLPTINFAVTCLTIGAGLMLMLGLGTPVAALAAAGFLLSIMATQPPWDPAVAESAKIYFGYQLVEVCALVVTMVIGTGRWFGLDGLFNYLLFHRGKQS
jgi:uncharacterized membrane protein YphA (DoxX/SURF4 family)